MPLPYSSAYEYVSSSTIRPVRASFCAVSSSSATNVSELLATPAYQPVLLSQSLVWYCAPVSMPSSIHTWYDASPTMIEPVPDAGSVAPCTS